MNLENKDFSNKDMTTGIQWGKKFNQILNNKIDKGLGKFNVNDEELMRYLLVKFRITPYSISPFIDKQKK